MDLEPTIETVGKPYGPLLYVPEFGSEVKTFQKPPKDGKDCLMHHVPFNKRGHFRPEQLATYDPNRKYRVDSLGYVLCYGKTTAGEKCRRRAENLSPRCNVHGGRLHPLDKAVKVAEQGSATEELTRYQLFLAKQLKVEDLDDEEIMKFGFRKPDGTIYRPRNIPRELASEFTKNIFERALNEIKANAVEAAKTLATIMVDPANDASIRLKAAEAILDRSIGKAPQQVNISAGAPWEEIFDGISTITRAQSRAQRGEVIDVDVVNGSGAPELEVSDFDTVARDDLPDALK